MGISAAALFLIGASVATAGTAYTVRQQNMTGKRMATIQGQQAAIFIQEDTPSHSL